METRTTEVAPAGSLPARVRAALPTRCSFHGLSGRDIRRATADSAHRRSRPWTQGCPHPGCQHSREECDARRADRAAEH
eukprot:1484938-Prymnesium_polylepis.1